ncbi:MAG: hypothetical protein P9L92_01780, partial [Candidatus Electryonea clarkiae]|nr:hypothetical protein [Candidatus Electryonea clarkiae]
TAKNRKTWFMQNNQEDLISLKAHICLKNTFSGDPKYVESDALHDELHHVELRIFRFLLALGLCLLKEVLARHGTGKSKMPIRDSNGDILYYHSVKLRQYLSIFGLIKINRAYFLMRLIYPFTVFYFS